MAMERKRTDEWVAFIEKLRNTPKEKLSKAAKYLLEHEGEEPTELNMRYVLK